jgi:hypothetical protein
MSVILQSFIILLHHLNLELQARDTSSASCQLFSQAKIFLLEFLLLLIVLFDLHHLLVFLSHQLVSLFFEGFHILQLFLSVLKLFDQLISFLLDHFQHRI